MRTKIDRVTIISHLVYSIAGHMPFFLQEGGFSLHSGQTEKRSFLYLQCFCLVCFALLVGLYDTYWINGGGDTLNEKRTLIRSRKKKCKFEKHHYSNFCVIQFFFCLIISRLNRHLDKIEIQIKNILTIAKKGAVSSLIQGLK